jgi:hypothetical protein
MPIVPDRDVFVESIGTLMDLPLGGPINPPA